MDSFERIAIAVDRCRLEVRTSQRLVAQQFHLGPTAGFDVGQCLGGQPLLEAADRCRRHAHLIGERRVAGPDRAVLVADAVRVELGVEGWQRQKIAYPS